MGIPTAVLLYLHLFADFFEFVIGVPIGAIDGQRHNRNIPGNDGVGVKGKVTAVDVDADAAGLIQPVVANAREGVGIIGAALMGDADAFGRGRDVDVVGVVGFQQVVTSDKIEHVFKMTDGPVIVFGAGGEGEADSPEGGEGDRRGGSGG